MMLCFRKHKLYEDLYRCQYNLAGIYQRTGNLSQALRHVDVSIKCATKMKDKLAERESLILKGKVGIIITTVILPILLQLAAVVFSAVQSFNCKRGGIFTSTRTEEVLQSVIFVVCISKFLLVAQHSGDCCSWPANLPYRAPD